MSDDTVKVVSILGNSYSIRAPAGQERALVDATALLKITLAETKQQYPSLIGDKLLVLAALNLCSRQLELQREHTQALNRYQEQLSATVELLSRTLAKN